MHWTNVRQLADVLARANGRRGAARLAALVADGPAPTRSELEDVVLDLILGAGLRRPAINERLGAVFPDLRWPDRRLTGQAVTRPHQTPARLIAAGAPYTDQQP